jgi:hypothetical protein
VIVIESFTKYTETLIALAQASFKGYDVWSYYNRMIRATLDKVKNDRAVVVFTGIDEIVQIAQPSGDTYNVRRIKVQGKQHEGCIEKEFLMVLFTEVKRDKDGVRYAMSSRRTATVSPPLRPRWVCSTSRTSTTTSPLSSTQPRNTTAHDNTA